MSILVDRTTRVVVQGITGKEGAFHAARCKEYGTTVVGGVTPGKGGTTHEGFAVWNTVEEAVRQEIPVVLGAMTPTEVATAVDLGATAVKVFPAARLGPTYFGDLHGPYPDTPLVATGGLNAENAAAFLAGGAIAVTAGSGVVSPKLAAESRLDEIGTRAKEFLAALT